jgi:hypothetical protein
MDCYSGISVLCGYFTGLAELTARRRQKLVLSGECRGPRTATNLYRKRKGLSEPENAAPVSQASAVQSSQPLSAGTAMANEEHRRQLQVLYLPVRGAIFLLAFLLVIGIFAYWSVLGFSLVSALNTRTNLLRNALLSPIFGAAANLLVVMWVNVAGMPLKRASIPITALLLTGAVLWLVRSRPVLPAKRLVPFLGVLMLAALLTGYPLLRYGFDWVSFGNDDMANYSLGATYLSNYGFFSQPSLGTILQDKDISTITGWFYLVGSGERPGIEFTNAWAASTFRLNSHQTYMPMMIALHLVLISTAGALFLQRRKYRFVAVLACFWMACSALLTLGTVYQLMAQVFGIALLAGACVMLCENFRPASRRMSLGRIALSSVMFGSLLVVYPEVLAFFFVTAFLYHSLALFRKQESWGAAVQIFSSVALISVLLVNVLLIGTASTAFHRLLSSKGAGPLDHTPLANIIFPFYLVPAGMAHLWGFFPIGQTYTVFSLGLGIIVGALLLLATCAAAVYYAWQGNTVAIMCLVMAGVGVRCFTAGADFGLYKVAMYVQPFLIGTAVLGWCGIAAYWEKKKAFRRWQTAVLLIPIALVVGSGLNAQFFYTQRSLGLSGGGFVEVPRVSDSHLVSQLLRMTPTINTQTTISDTHNVVLAKFEGNYPMSGSLFFTAYDFMSRFMEATTEPTPYHRFLDRVFPDLRNKLDSISQTRAKRFQDVQFDTHGALPEPDAFRVRIDTFDSALSHATLLQSSGDQGIFNRRSMPPGLGFALRAVDLAQAHNQLLYVASSFGTPYYGFQSNRSLGRVSMYQPEDDYYYPQTTMVSLGRDSLLRILSPSREFRLSLEYTATLNADHESRIPPISIIGKERQFLLAEGRGSARLFSPVVQPQEIGGGAYLLLDMGTWGFRFPERRVGVMALYGKDIPLDSRRIVGFGRDVSAISEEEYEQLAVPEHVQSFPADLANKALEYSGFYEDGWVAESSYLKLRQSADDSPLIVHVMVPLVAGKPASSHITILVDGSAVAGRNLTPGECELVIPAAGGGKRNIELVFDKAVNLPDPDNRPVSAMIRFVGFRGHDSR